MSRGRILNLNLERSCSVRSMGCTDGDVVWRPAGIVEVGSEAVNLMLLQGESRERPAMEEECSARPCATDFSIAAIMARDRQERRERRRHRDPREDTLTPLGLSLLFLLILLNPIQ